MKTKRKLPKFIDINTFDFTPYGRELTREEAYRVNGGDVNEDVHTVQSEDTLGTLVYNYNQEHGTNISLNSEGEWIINSKTDVSGYNWYMKGFNIYDMNIVYRNDKIDIEKQLKIL